MGLVYACEYGDMDMLSVVFETVVQERARMMWGKRARDLLIGAWEGVCGIEGWDRLSRGCDE